MTRDILEEARQDIEQTMDRMRHRLVDLPAWDKDGRDAIQSTLDGLHDYGLLAVVHVVNERARDRRIEELEREEERAEFQNSLHLMNAQACGR